MGSAERLQVILNHLQKPLHPAIKRTGAGNYVYTTDNYLLTDQQRAFYEENGFIVIPKLIEDNLLQKCRQRFVDICDGKVDKGHIILMKDKSLMKTNAKGEFLYNKIQDIIWDDILSQYILHPKILQYVECFTGPNITVVNSMLINKPPDSGKMTSIHPLHQDLHYFSFRPAERIVASWTAMETITVENGCLFVIPGTHKGVLQPHDYPENEVNKAFHAIKGFDLVPRVNLEMEKGDTVFFHPLLMHGSGPNITTGFRKAISCHYASSNCHFIDIKGTIQENIAEEVKQVYKRKGLDISYQNEVNKAHHGIKGFDLVPRVNLKMEKGDTVFFHPLLMYGLGPNITTGFQKAISNIVNIYIIFRFSQYFPDYLHFNFVRFHSFDTVKEILMTLKWNKNTVDK